MKPDGTNGGGGVGGIGGVGSLPESSDFFFEKTIASIIPISIRIPTTTPIIIFLFFLLYFY